MYELKPIRVFLEVAKLQSFAGAAKNLKLTPASVTRIVAKLEEEFGEQLLLRTTRQVSLTSTGALVAARYQPLVEAFDRAEQDLARAIQPFRGRLSINAPMSFGLQIIPNLIQSFRLAYPSIDLNIRLTDRFVDILSENCDVAIRVSAPPEDKSSIWRKLCEVPLKVVASPALFDRHLRPKSPDELDDSICLSYGIDDTPEIWNFEKGAIKRPTRSGSSINTNNGDVLYQLARSGSGIVMLPEFLVADGIKIGEVVPILEDWSIPPLWLSLFYPPYDALPPLVATFTDFFEAFLKEIDGFEF